MRLKLLYFSLIMVLAINTQNASTGFVAFDKPLEYTSLHRLHIRTETPKRAHVVVSVGGYQSQHSPMKQSILVKDGNSPIEEVRVDETVTAQRARSLSVDLIQQLSPIDIIARLIQEENIQRSGLITQEVLALSAIFDKGTQSLLSIIAKQKAHF